MTLTIITINPACLTDISRAGRYNNAAGLRKTMESVLSQTSKDFEYIIIDGASTDGSVQTIQQFNNSTLQQLNVSTIQLHALPLHIRNTILHHLRTNHPQMAYRKITFQFAGNRNYG